MWCPKCWRKNSEKSSDRVDSKYPPLSARKEARNVRRKGHFLKSLLSAFSLLFSHPPPPFLPFFYHVTHSWTLLRPKISSPFFSSWRHSLFFFLHQIVFSSTHSLFQIRQPFKDFHVNNFQIVLVNVSRAPGCLSNFRFHSLSISSFLLPLCLSPLKHFLRYFSIWTRAADQERSGHHWECERLCEKYALPGMLLTWAEEGVKSSRREDEKKERERNIVSSVRRTHD